MSDKEYVISEKLLQAIINVLQELPAKTVLRILNEVLDLKLLESEKELKESVKNPTL